MLKYIFDNISELLHLNNLYLNFKSNLTFEKVRCMNRNKQKKQKLNINRENYAVI